MFEEFSPTCRKSIDLARVKAARAGERELTPLRLLQALLQTPQSRAPAILKALNVDPDALARHFEADLSMPADSPTEAGIPFSPGCLAALDLALVYQRKFGHSRAGTDHLLLGIFLIQDPALGPLFRAHSVTEGLLANQVELNRQVKDMERLGRFLDGLPSATVPALAALGERYSDAARLVVREAFRLAKQYGNPLLGIEHLLLALVRLLRLGRIQTRVMDHDGLDLDEITPLIERKLVGAREPQVAEIDFTVKSKRVLELAIQEAYLAEAAIVDVDHLVLGLLGLEKGFAGDILHADLAGARLRLLTRSLSAGPRPTADGWPEIDLARYRIDRTILHLLPIEVAQRCLAVPLHASGRELTVAMADPDDPQAMNELRRAVSQRLAVVQAPADQIRDVLGLYA